MPIQSGCAHISSSLFYAIATEKVKKLDDISTCNTTIQLKLLKILPIIGNKFAQIVKLLNDCQKKVQKNLCTAFTEVKQKEVYRKKKTGTVSRRWDTFLRKKEVGAGDEARTRYLHLGKVALYRMSYARITEFV